MDELTSKAVCAHNKVWTKLANYINDGVISSADVFSDCKRRLVQQFCPEELKGYANSSDCILCAIALYRTIENGGYICESCPFYQSNPRIDVYGACLGGLYNELMYYLGVLQDRTIPFYLCTREAKQRAYEIAATIANLKVI